MIADFDEVYKFADKKLQEAKDGAELITFLDEAIARSGDLSESNNRGFRLKAAAITDIPKYKFLIHGTGLSAWATVLAVDLRHSSRRALDIGAENTYLTMHTYLRTMAHIVHEAGGYVVGLRGDGLFAAFGLTESQGEKEVWRPEVASASVGNAVSCGKAMIEGIQDIIDPILSKNGVPGNLAVGVGVDVGNIVVTRIGYENASEVTAYGPPINHVCKTFARGSNAILVSTSAWRIYPTSSDGRIGSRPFSGGMEVLYPHGLNELGGAGSKRRTRTN